LFKGIISQGRWDLDNCTDLEEGKQGIEKDPSECQVSTGEEAWHTNQNGSLNLFIFFKREPYFDFKQ
jgi:hypothetical protein